MEYQVNQIIKNIVTNEKRRITGIKKENVAWVSIKTGRTGYCRKDTIRKWTMGNGTK